MDMRHPGASAAFVSDLHRALRHLYDPLELGRSRLIDDLGIARRADPPSALRQLLLQAIEALKPAPSVPLQASAWRIYHILSQRFAEQFTQREVAANLALGTRQLGRLEGTALQALADHLWTQHDLASREHVGAQLPTPPAQPPASGSRTPSQEQELQWLEMSCPSEPAEVTEILEAALKVARPLAKALQVQVECHLPGQLPHLAVRLTTVRQALLNILTAAIRSVPGGRVDVEAEAELPLVRIRVRPALRRQAASPASTGHQTEGLEMAGRLLGLSGGSLAVLPGRDQQGLFTATIALPAVGQVTVLVVDDNTDTLQLLQRYLSGSRYRFVGVPDPARTIELAEEAAPQIVVLDVMLPGLDGWELLGRLRENPKTRGVPVIVCTILPQEDLATTLGAAGYLRKPVTQMAFLSALDQQLAPQCPGSA